MILLVPVPAWWSLIYKAPPINLPFWKTTGPALWLHLQAALPLRFGQIESIDRLSETELRCTLCLLDVVLAALAKDECFCPNREIIRLVLTRTYVQNRCELCETEEIRSKLMKGFCTWEKKNGLSRKNEIRRRGISFFYGAILEVCNA